MPQIIFDVSTDLLTTIVHDAIASELSCIFTRQNPANLKKTVDTVVTNVTINAITPIRGDESGHGAGAIFQGLRSQFGLATAVDVSFMYGFGKGYTTTSTFLLVEGSATAISPGDLDTKGSSTAGGTNLTTDITGPILVRVSAQASADHKQIEIHLTVENIFNLEFAAMYANLFSGDPAKRTKVFKLPLNLAAAGINGIVNAGVATEPWTGRRPRGLRLGVVVYNNPDYDHLAWWEFFQRTKMAIDPSKGQHWGVYLHPSFFLQAVNRLLIVHQDDLFTGWADIDNGEGSLDVQVPINYQPFNDTPLGPTIGDVVLSLTPSVFTAPDPDPAQHARPATFLSVRLCVSFDVSIEFALAAGVILAVLSPVIDGLIGGVLAPVLAFVVGVGSLAIGAIGDIVGNALAQDKLAGLTLPAQCGPPDGNGCRECHQEVDFFIPFVTHLFLRDAKVVDDGVLIIGAAAPDPAARPLPVIGTMSEVVLGKWFYPTVICQGADGNPRRTVSFTNTGQLPLYVCEVAQRITDPTTQPAILGIDRSIHEPGPAAIPVGAGDKAMVPPGATYVASVVAKVIGAAGYDQQNPPPLLLRILSSGGDQVIDLNGPGDAARPISPAEADFAERISEILCHALSWEEFEHLEWHAIAYTDPVPFRQSDRIIERLDVASQAPPAGTIVRALNSAQELLALSYGAGGAMQLSVEATRPPATAHRLTRIAFDVSPAIGAKQDRAGLGEAAAPKGARRSLRRLLYREAALFDVGPPILAAARAGSHLAVLTGDEVLIAAVGAVHLTRWTRRPVRAEALTSDGRHLLLAGARGILALDNQLRVVWRTETPGRALAHHGRSLWSADAEAITEWQHEADGWSARQRISLSDVTQLLATRQGAFALSGGWIWHLTEGQARPIGLRSAGLLTVAGAPSALSGDGAFVFDAHGRVRANYLQVPRAAAALHFPGVAVEVRPARGALVLHDVWETALDLNAAENQRPGVL